MNYYSRKLLVGVLGISLLIPTVQVGAHNGVDHSKETHSTTHQSMNAKMSTPMTSNAAVDFRIAFDRLLSEHASLAIIAMQKGIDGAPDFEASAAALNENTLDLTAAIRSVYGQEAGDAFNKMWNQHIGFFVDYVVATSKKDEEGKKKALANLDNYREEFSQFLAGANPNISAAGLADSLQMHVTQLVTAFDNYAQKDYTKTYDSIREATHHMFMAGDFLAGAIVTQFPAKFDHHVTSTPAADFRSALDQLLSEHAYLAIIAMQKGFDGAADFEAAAGALNKNTVELSASIASVYGQDAGKAFQKMWNDHIGFFVDYVVATSKKDDAGRKVALEKLDQYRFDFSNFLAGANPNIKADSLAAGLQGHVNQLVAAFDHYVQKDYTKAYNSIREAYHHMFLAGDSLAAAIVAQFPEKFAQKSEPIDSPTTVIAKLKIGSKTLKVNDSNISLDVAPFVWQGKTYVSLRALAEAVGAEVKWDAQTETIWVINGDDKITFWVGEDFADVNGNKVNIGAKVFIRDGRTQIPLRWIASLLEWKVDWNHQDWSVTLTKTMK